MRPLLKAILVVVVGFVTWKFFHSFANRIPTRATPGGILWESRYNSPDNESDMPGGMVLDPSGDVVVFGSSFGGVFGNSVFIKHEGLTGKELWVQRYLGTNNKGAETTSLSVDAQGDLYAAGSEQNGYLISPLTPSSFSGPDDDILVLKHSGKNGASKWKQTYAGRNHDIDHAQEVALDTSGNPVIAGFAPNGTNTYGYLAKYAAADGHLIWEHCGEDASATPLWHGSSAMKLDAHDDVVFAGSISGSQDPFKPSADTCFIQKHSGKDGHLIWRKGFNEEAENTTYIQSLDLDREGNVFVVGYASDGRRTKVVTAKFGTLDGAMLWSTSYQSPLKGDGRPSAILVDSGGDVIVSCQSSNGTYTNEGHTLKYAGADGKLRWEQTRPVPWSSGVVTEACAKRGLILDRHGAIILYGNKWNGSNIDYHLTWLSSKDGRTLREVSYDGPAGDHDLIAEAIVAPDGAIIVTGSSSNCPQWRKPMKSLSYWLRTGRSWSNIQRESNHVNDNDPYNYDFMTVKYPPFPDLEAKN